MINLLNISRHLSFEIFVENEKPSERRISRKQWWREWQRKKDTSESKGGDSGENSSTTLTSWNLILPLSWTFSSNWKGMEGFSFVSVFPFHQLFSQASIPHIWQGMENKNIDSQVLCQQIQMNPEEFYAKRSAESHPQILNCLQFKALNWPEQFRGNKTWLYFHHLVLNMTNKR